MKKPDKKSEIQTRSIVLLLGHFENEFYDFLKKRRQKMPVYILEGRPDFASSRKTCQELLKRKITPTVIADNTAGFLFFRDFVKEVWVAYQAIDQGDVLCDIGGLILGVLAKRHRVPLYASAGVKKSRFVGNPEDICSLEGVRCAPVGVKGFVPLLDLVPRKYVKKTIGK